LLRKAIKKFGLTQAKRTPSRLLGERW
jgi:hypothetical protein